MTLHAKNSVQKARPLNLEGRMTPAEITKLKEHAERAKGLMRKSAVVGAQATTVLDRYEQTLATFEANIDRLSREESDLKAAMAAMGNAGPALDAAFQDDPSTAANGAAPNSPVEAQPSESAHLHKVLGGESDAA
jgi:hypothetical protein